jgi:hypothetical protein
MKPKVIPENLVMIPRYVDDTGPLSGFAQEFLDNRVVYLRPIGVLLQAPAIEYVPDKVEGLRPVVAQEIEKELSLTTPSPEVDIR